VELAMRTGAPMFAGWVPRTGIGRYSLYLERIPMPAPSGDRTADVEAGTAVMVAAIEDGIRRWPDQWFVLAPIWGTRKPETAPALREEEQRGTQV
jgi:lauroyl/myristoyl acyltransferase